MFQGSGIFRSQAMPTVLVTGANRGIGLEFVRQYAEAGDRVIAVCRRPDQAKALAGIAARSDGRVTTPAADVGDDAAMAALKAQVGDQPIDIVVANAGVMGPQDQHRPGQFDFAGWLETLSVNTLGPMRTAEAFLPNLKAGREKKLIAITSGMGSTAEAGGGYLAYRSSKAALNNAWRNLAPALRGDGVTAVVISPGWVRTDMGGAGAELTPEQSVTAMRKLIAGFTPKDSGRFLGVSGADVAW
jgi:NAD(P)-dependent dehydrogenase (short-subunit alcohol dehydrogenase family)